MKDSKKRDKQIKAILKELKIIILNIAIYLLILLFLVIFVIIMCFLSALFVIFIQSVGNPNSTFISLIKSDFWKLFIILLKANGIVDFFIFSIIPKRNLLGDDD